LAPYHTQLPLPSFLAISRNSPPTCHYRALGSLKVRIRRVRGSYTVAYAPRLRNNGCPAINLKAICLLPPPTSVEPVNRHPPLHLHLLCADDSTYSGPSEPYHGPLLPHLSILLSAFALSVESSTMPSLTRLVVRRAQLVIMKEDRPPIGRCLLGLHVRSWGESCSHPQRRRCSFLQPIEKMSGAR